MLNKEAVYGKLYTIQCYPLHVGSIILSLEAKELVSKKQDNASVCYYTRQILLWETMAT